MGTQWKHWQTLFSWAPKSPQMVTAAMKLKDTYLLLWRNAMTNLKESESESCSVLSDSLELLGLYSPWNFPGQNTGMGNCSLFQGIFPTQGSNPGRPHCRRILYQQSHYGSQRILEWVAYPFSRGFSQPKDRTQISCIADRCFTLWATTEAQTFIREALEYELDVSS